MSSQYSPLIVRFAPSPTGELHLGGARTALYNYLLAKKTGGRFIIRIEDTDQNRYVAGSANRLLEDLQWLGLSWDEGMQPDGVSIGDNGPYVQSERLPMYTQAVENLIAAGHAYKDYLTAEELSLKRETLRTAGVLAMKEDHLRLSPDEERTRAENNTPYVVRLRTPVTGECTFEDQIRGTVSIPWAQVDDQVLLKSDGYPTYHLAVVVDDHAMGINLVLRAEEWLPSTPKHILLYQLFGWETPTFAHLPLILNADKSKMSKRKDGDKVWLSSYKNTGYVPEAMINYLALLGWHEAGDREFYTLQELIGAFDLSRVQKSGAIFDREKLLAMNAAHLRSMPQDEFIRRAKAFIPTAISQALSKIGETVMEQAIVSLQSQRVQILSEIPAMLEDFLGNAESFDPAMMMNGVETARVIAALNLNADFIEKNPVQGDEPTSIKQTLEQLAEANGFSRKESFGPLRLALTRKKVSIDPFAVLSVLPTQEAIRRIREVCGMMH